MPAADAAMQSADLALLLEAGREAGRIAMRYFERSPDVWLKDGNSPVSEADIEVDRFLERKLMEARPDYGWLSEETVRDPAHHGRELQFVIDPIDGTRGFIDGQKTWCVCLAVVANGKTVAGVLECPATGETFHAVPGGGAFRNGRKISVSARVDDFHIAGPREMAEDAGNLLGRNVKRRAHVPSLAYRIALVATGELDATFVKPNAHDWDLAAADIILREAGGVLLANASGAPPVYGGHGVRHGALIACPADLAATLSKVLESA